MSLPFELPTNLTLQLLCGAVYAESSTKWYGGEDQDEKQGIAWTILNMSYYATYKAPGKSRNYNATFGNGSVLGAIKQAIVAYGQRQWNQVMSGNTLKPASALERELNRDEIAHLELVVRVVAPIGASPDLPHALACLDDRITVQFNRAADSPPSKERQERIGRLGRHTFYGFKPGRECD